MGISYGNRHRLLEQRLWQKLLEPLLPPRLQGREVAAVGTPANRLVIWFLPVGGPLGWHRPRWLEALDEHGCCMGRGVECGFPASMGSYRVGTLEAFPRRAGRFYLRIYERGAAAQAAEFTVANPAPGPYPSWKPDPFPIEKRQGDLAVRLMALATGLTRESLRQSRSAGRLDERHTSADVTGRDRLWALATFRAAENGAPTDRWQVASIVISDATGNTASYRPAAAGVGDDYFGFKGGNTGGTASFQPLDAVIPMGADILATDEHRWTQMTS